MGKFRYAYIAKLFGSVACVAVGALCSIAGFFGLYTHSMGVQQGTIAAGTVPSDTNLFLAVLGLLVFLLGYFFLMKQVRGRSPLRAACCARGHVRCMFVSLCLSHAQSRPLPTCPLPQRAAPQLCDTTEETCDQRRQRCIKEDKSKSH